MLDVIRSGDLTFSAYGRQGFGCCLTNWKSMILHSTARSRTLEATKLKRFGGFPADQTLQPTAVHFFIFTNSARAKIKAASSCNSDLDEKIFVTFCCTSAYSSLAYENHVSPPVRLNHFLGPFVFTGMSEENCCQKSHFSKQK